MKYQFLLPKFKFLFVCVFFLFLATVNFHKKSDKWYVIEGGF